MTVLEMLLIIIILLQATANVFSYHETIRKALDAEEFTSLFRYSFSNQPGEKQVDKNNQDEIVDSAVVRTSFGILHGNTYHDSHAFYKVPYAMPPIGRYR